MLLDVPRRAGSLRLALALNMLAIVLFDSMGLIIKHLSSHYGAAELSAWRNLFGLVPAIIALWSFAEWHRRGRRWRIRQWPSACLRGVFLTFAQFMFYIALGQLAFATATTIIYTSAIFVTAFSVPILRERVGVVRWIAVGVGFAGVMLVVRPGSDTFTLYALLPLGAAALYALAGVIARTFDDDVPSPLANLYSSCVAAAGAIVLTTMTSGFTDVRSLVDFGWIVAMGGFGGCAVLCLVIAYRMTEPSNLAPFSYFGIPSAFLMGWAFFGETPFDDLFPGALLIVAGGLMIVWRERALKRRLRALSHSFGHVGPPRGRGEWELAPGKQYGCVQVQINLLPHVDAGGSRLRLSLTERRSAKTITTHSPLPLGEGPG